MRVLLVKMSSLGDVVHTLAAVTDALRARPGLSIDWVAEESYQTIPGWHPGVRRVIPIALRRWRRSPWAMIRDREWFQFRTDLRRDEYDLVLDAQGLIKSGWIARQARGAVAGRSRHSAREPLAAAFYRQKHEVDLNLPEVEQLRQLFARALDYPMPETPANFGIEPKRIPPANRMPGYVVLAHGAAWKSKLWPVASWASLAMTLAGEGLKVLLPWGSDEERARAGQIAAGCGGEVLPRLDIPQIAGVLAHADLVVGLDTGITHIAIALGRPAITLYGPSVPVYAHVAGNRVIHLASSEAKKVDTQRENTVALAEVLDAVARIRGAKQP